MGMPGKSHHMSEYMQGELRRETDLHVLTAKCSGQHHLITKVHVHIHVDRASYTHEVL